MQGRDGGGPALDSVRGSLYKWPGEGDPLDDVAGAFEHLTRRAGTDGLARLLAVLEAWAPIEVSDPEGRGFSPGKWVILRGAWDAGEHARCPLGWLGYQAGDQFPAPRTGAAVNAFTALWDAEGERAISRQEMRDAIAAELARRSG